MTPTARLQFYWKEEQANIANLRRSDSINAPLPQISSCDFSRRQGSSNMLHKRESVFGCDAAADRNSANDPVQSLTNQ